VPTKRERKDSLCAKATGNRQQRVRSICKVGCAQLARKAAFGSANIFSPIGHFHARDATVGLPDHSGAETRLGEGEVDLTALLMVFHAAEYRGAYILRRTASTYPIEDLLAAQAALKQHVADFL